jgi:hypothetical protein
VDEVGIIDPDIWLAAAPLDATRRRLPVVERGGAQEVA